MRSSCGRGEEHRVRDDEHQEQQQRREQAPRAPQPERAERDAAGVLALAEQQRRDEEPAEDEEEVDAEEATLRPVEPAVVAEHADDRERAQSVECRLIADPAGHFEASRYAPMRREQ